MHRGRGLTDKHRTAQRNFLNNGVVIKARLVSVINRLQKYTDMIYINTSRTSTNTKQSFWTKSVDIPMWFHNRLTCSINI